MRSCVLFLSLFLAGALLWAAGQAMPAAANQADLAALFAPPTPAEMDSVRSDWAARQPAVISWTVHTSATILSHPVWIVSQRIDGERHYGAIRFPMAFQSDRLYPVLVYNHKGNYLFLEAELAVLDAALMGDCPAQEFIYVMPSFRGEYILSSYLGTFTSQGAQSRLNYDVDDSMALLADVLARVPQADAARVVTLGVSRGAGVSLLQGARDGRLRRLVDYFGPADMFLPSLRADAEYWVDHGGPPPDAVNDAVLPQVMEIVLPYVDGSTPLAEARQALLQSSPAYFGQTMPPLQIHHGTADEAVPIGHSNSLNAKLGALGDAPPFAYYTYPGGDHNIATLAGSGDRITPFLCDLVPTGLAAALRSQPAPVPAGDSLTYHLLVTNTNAVSLTATITQVMPPSVTPADTLIWQTVIPAGQTWSSAVAVQTAPDYLGTLASQVIVTTREGVTAQVSNETEAVPTVTRLIFLPMMQRP